MQARKRGAGLGDATDDDAFPDRHWLTYLVQRFMASDHAALGGPNIPPEDETDLAICVAGAPGGPVKSNKRFRDG